MIYKEQKPSAKHNDGHRKNTETKERKLQLIEDTMFYQYDDKASKD